MGFLPVRKMSLQLLEAMDEGVIEAKVLAEMCILWMTEKEVVEMARVYELTNVAEWSKKDD
jgi:hypothetical protein